MKTRIAPAILVMLTLLSTLNLQLSTALAQGTAFTYQGRLNLNGTPASGNYDLQFILFNTNQFGFPAAPILTNSAVAVNNGLFTTTLDFGGGIFTGTNFWLDISVRTNGSGGFTDLSPRQPIVPAPYAVTAENIASVVEHNFISGGGGTVGGGNNNTVSNFNATISGGANNVAGGNASNVGGGSENDAAGDHAMIGGGQGNNNDGDHSSIVGGVGNYIGSGTNTGSTIFYSFIGGGINNSSFASDSVIGGGAFNAINMLSQSSVVAGGEDNLIQVNATDSAIGGGGFNTIQAGSGYSTVGGGYFNTVQSNTSFSTIGGGIQNTIQTNASYSVIGGGEGNTIQTNAQVSFIGGGDFNTIQANGGGSVIGGGVQNTIQTNAQESTIGGGVFNNIQINAGWSTIGGGIENTIQPYATYSTVGGGRFNTIQTNGQQSVIGGGYQNTVQPNAQNDFIGGGYFNVIQANAYASTIGCGGLNTNGGSYSTIPGGYENSATGNYSLAAGRQAQALHQGAFVWADSQSATFASTANDQFLVRAEGGVGINMNNPGGASLSVQGNRTGGWGSSVGVFENTSTASGSSPALRVVVRGGSAPDGALNVSDNGTGPIAEFGNGIGFVASVENDGTVISKGVVLTSDRNAKENFTALDAQTVLAKVAAMPVTEWNYREDAADKRHIGPVAQDFQAAFGLNGGDDKHISVVDEGGVALAAIQGLNRKLEVRSEKVEVWILNSESRMQKLEEENADLRQRNNLLERRLEALEEKVLK